MTSTIHFPSNQYKNKYKYKYKYKNNCDMVNQSPHQLPSPPSWPDTAQIFWVHCSAVQCSAHGVQCSAVQCSEVQCVRVEWSEDLVAVACPLWAIASSAIHSSQVAPHHGATLCSEDTGAAFSWSPDSQCMEVLIAHIGQISEDGEDSKYLSYICKFWACINTGTCHLVGANLRNFDGQVLWMMIIFIILMII
jgi:hypothetical protein